MPLAGTFRFAPLTRLRLRGEEGLSLIEVEKQPVFVCSSDAVLPVAERLRQLLPSVWSLAGNADRRPVGI